MNYKSFKIHSLLSFLHFDLKLNNLDKQSHFLEKSLPMKSKLFVSDNLQFNGMIKRWVLAKRIKLHSVCNELIGEFFIQDLLDVRLVQTVLQRALVAKSETVSALVFQQSRSSLLFCQSLWYMIDLLVFLCNVINHLVLIGWHLWESLLSLALFLLGLLQFRRRLVYNIAICFIFLQLLSLQVFTTR